MKKNILLVTCLSVVIILASFIIIFDPIKNNQNIFFTAKPTSFPSPQPTKVPEKIDYSKIIDSKGLVAAFNVFGQKQSGFDSDGCYWSLEIAGLNEFIPNKLVEIDIGKYLTKKTGSSCTANIGDGYPSEGGVLIAQKVNNKWQIVNDVNKMCLLIKDVPAAKNLFQFMQSYYGVCNQI